MNIGNVIGKYIKKVEPRDGMFAYARICVEVYLKKGLLDAIQLNLDNWSFIQQVEYNQIPYSCKNFHEYDHLARGCLNKVPK